MNSIPKKCNEVNRSQLNSGNSNSNNDKSANSPGSPSNVVTTTVTESDDNSELITQVPMAKCKQKMTSPKSMLIYV